MPKVQLKGIGNFVVFQLWLVNLGGPSNRASNRPLEREREKSSILIKHELVVNYDKNAFLPKRQKMSPLINCCLILLLHFKFIAFVILLIIIIAGHNWQAKLPCLDTAFTTITLSTI